MRALTDPPTDPPTDPFPVPRTDWFPVPLPSGTGTSPTGSPNRFPDPAHAANVRSLSGACELLEEPT